MASYRGIVGALHALRGLLGDRIEAALGDSVENPRVTLLGSRDLREAPSGNQLGICLHRISVDAFGRNRHLQPTRADQLPRPELPVNLHVLLLGWCTAAPAEVSVVSWAVQQLGSALVLDASHLSPFDPSWGTGDAVQVIPEEMSTEDLMRIWDGLRHEYVLSSPYIVKTIRLEPARAPDAGPPVLTVAVPFGTELP